jgi:C4-type Zn-finger protein
MTCPLCHQDSARRSRRHSITDYLLSAAGVYPWRCQGCNARFYARLMPLSHSLRAHCPVCGNLALKRISADYVDSLSGPLWRFLRIPAFRCEPCRYKYFSILPMYREANKEAEAPTGD